jgi:hypothetical protein
MDHTFRTSNFIYTISLLTDTQLLAVGLFGESLRTSSLGLLIWRVPEVRLSYTMASVVAIRDVAQKVWTIPLIINLIRGRNFEKSYD